MKFHSRLRFVFALCAFPVLLPSVHAASYQGSSMESFVYTDGTSLKTAGTAAGGTGFNAKGTNAANTTSWGPSTATGTTINPGPGTAAVTGGQAVATGNATGAGSAYRDLAQTVNSGDFYFSFSTSSNVTTQRSANFALLGLIDGSYTSTAGATANTTQTEKLAFGQNSNANAAFSTNGNFGLNYFNSQTTGAVNAASPVAFNGTLTLVVGHIIYNASGNLDRVLFYLNPMGVTENTASAYIDDTSVDLGTVTTLRLFAGGTSTVANATAAASANFVDIRLGTTYLGVVPEPGSMTLLTGGVILAAAIYRRRLKRA